MNHRTGLVTNYLSLDQIGQNMNLIKCPSIYLALFKSYHLTGGQTLKRSIQTLDNYDIHPASPLHYLLIS